MNCDTNALSQAASCFLCLSDDQLNALVLYLTCQWASVSAPPLPAGLSVSLILRNEGFSLDSFSDGQAVTSWQDLSGQGHHWTTMNAITADRTRLAGKHPTLRFDGTNSYGQQPFFLPAGTGLPGLTMMGVFKQDTDPPPFLNEGSIATFNHPVVFPPHHPYSDGLWYECMGRNDRPSFGNPTMSVAAAFRGYAAVAPNPATTYNAYLRGGGSTENFFSGGAFTFQQQGLETTAAPNIGGPNYSLGRGWRYDNLQTHTLQGNIAALFLWSRALSVAELNAMWAYLETNYGI